MRSCSTSRQEPSPSTSCSSRGCLERRCSAWSSLSASPRPSLPRGAFNHARPRCRCPRRASQLPHSGADHPCRPPCRQRRGMPGRHRFRRLRREAADVNAPSRWGVFSCNSVSADALRFRHPLLSRHPRAGPAGPSTRCRPRIRCRRRMLTGLEREHRPPMRPWRRRRSLRPSRPVAVALGLRRPRRRRCRRPCRRRLVRHRRQRLRRPS